MLQEDLRGDPGAPVADGVGDALVHGSGGEDGPRGDGRSRDRRLRGDSTIQRRLDRVSEPLHQRRQVPPGLQRQGPERRSALERLLRRGPGAMDERLPRPEGSGPRELARGLPEAFRRDAEGDQVPLILKVMLSDAIPTHLQYIFNLHQYCLLTYSDVNAICISLAELFLLMGMIQKILIHN